MTLFFFIIHIFVLLWLLLGYINAIIKRNKQKIISEENFSEFTILIAARNEEKNLSALLQSLQKQKIDWAKGKIVLVLDRCNDNSLSIAKEFKQQMPYLTIIENSKNPGNISPKKAALIRGLQEITTPIVLQTDADVTLPPEWIKSHLELHSTENAAVIGLFNFHLPDNLWGKWLLGEKLWTFLISIGSFGWNLPFLAFGSNISFNTKKLNYSKQLENFLHSISGDDDLIIQTLKGSKQKAAFISNFSQLPITTLPQNLSAFIKQRKRHLSAGNYFSLPTKIFYALFVGSWSFFLFSLPFSTNYWYLFLIKTILDYFILFHLGKVFPQKFGMLNVILIEIFYIPYLWITGALSQLQKINWK